MAHQPSVWSDEGQQEEVGVSSHGSHPELPDLALRADFGIVKLGEVQHPFQEEGDQEARDGMEGVHLDDLDIPVLVGNGLAILTT